MSNNTLAVAFDEKNTDAIFAELDQCRCPGAAVAIAIGGKPTFRMGLWLASMELPVVCRPRYAHLYSRTEHFTYRAYMLLCEWVRPASIIRLRCACPIRPCYA